LPGIDPKNVDIKVSGGILTVKGSREQKSETKKGDFFRSEIRYGSFERSLSLPEGMKAEDLKANYHDGVLELTAPMPKEAVAKEIRIQIGGDEAKKDEGGKKTA
jgi:HSP20 family protein